jgi:hypothetical protein
MEHQSIPNNRTLMVALVREGGIWSLEDYTMHVSNRFLASLFLTAALAVPVAIVAAPAPQDPIVEVRVYDKDRKDYHNWDDRENKAWGEYQTDKHSSLEHWYF